MLEPPLSFDSYDEQNGSRQPGASPDTVGDYYQRDRARSHHDPHGGLALLRTAERIEGEPARRGGGFAGSAARSGGARRNVRRADFGESRQRPEESAACGSRRPRDL